ncbi:MAG: hypothetical protein ABI898_09390 [Sphingomonadales bacterium]
MKKLNVTIAFSTALMMAGCSDKAPEQQQPQAKPVGLMSSEAVQAAPVEAMPIENATADNAIVENAAGMTERRSQDSRTIGDRREN